VSWGIVLLLAPAARAELPPLSDRPSETPIERAMNGAPPPSGSGERYVGVALGPSSRNPLPPARKGPPHLIWSGFQSSAGGSRVFFQTNQTVTFSIGPSSPGPGGKAGTVSVFLKNCRIHLRNNSRHLDTRFFPTPVEGVTVVQRRNDVELRIALKQPATPTPHSEPGPDGTQFLVLEFPPGQAALDGAESPGEDEGASSVAPAPQK
jgi:hypothetical protein